MPHKKLAYDQGVQKALQDAGLLQKKANISQVKQYVSQGMTPQRATRKAYPSWDKKQVNAFLQNNLSVLKRRPKLATPGLAKKANPSEVLQKSRQGMTVEKAMQDVYSNVGKPGAANISTSPAGPPPDIAATVKKPGTSTSGTQQGVASSGGMSMATNPGK
jgi:hypothetical protein